MDICGRVSDDAAAAKLKEGNSVGATRATSLSGSTNKALASATTATEVAKAKRETTGRAKNPDALSQIIDHNGL